jgi:Protein of unknown function (DUF2442)
MIAKMIACPITSIGWSIAQKMRPSMNSWHPNHTVTVTWSDGVTADVDLSSVIAKGNVFAPLADTAYFVATVISQS